MSDTRPKRDFICPFMGVTLRTSDDGYHATLRWAPKSCAAEWCAVWTDDGCGMANGRTRMAAMRHPTEDAGRPERSES